MSTSNDLVTPRDDLSVFPQGFAATPFEIEKWTDVYFIRPLGSIFASLAGCLRLTPTQVTVFGALVGIAGGAMLFDQRLGLVAFALLIIHGIIDSADGQLARDTGRVTELGRVLDGGSGYVTHAAIYVAIAAGVIHRGGSATILITMVLAGIATIVQAQMYEYYRRTYTDVVAEGRPPLSDPAKVAPWLRGLFRGYMSMQRWLIGLHAKVEATLAERSIAGIVRQEDRIRYRDYFCATVRGWNLLGDSTRFFAIGVLACFHRIDLLFAFVLLPMNLALIALWLRQRRVDQRFLASL